VYNTAAMAFVFCKNSCIQKVSSDGYV